MTVQTPPWAIHGQTHPGEVARAALAAIFGAPVAALTGAVGITTAGGSHGVIGAGDLAVSQNGTPNMSVNVAAGRAVIRSTEAASVAAGAYSFLSTATVNLAVAAADGTNPRRDLVVAQVRDANYAGASNDARLFVVTGTPAGSPADPAIPNSCLVLARIQVGAGVTSITNANITDLRTRAWAVGGTAVAAAAAGLPSGASLSDGLSAYITGNDRPSGSGVVVPHSSVPAGPGLWVYDGRWNPPWNMPWGVMGYAEITASPSTFTTVVDVAGLSITFTAAANRRVRITAAGILSSSVNNDVARLLITDGSNNQLQPASTGVMPTATIGHSVLAAVVKSPSAGSTTYKVRAERATGTGNITFTAASTAPAYILVEDIGPNGSPA